MAFRSLPNPWSQETALVRPLLSTWRSEINAYLEQRGIQPIEDLSNQDVRFQRNRIRHELLPMLEAYQPGLYQRLWQTARLASEDLTVLNGVVETAWRDCVDASKLESGWIAFNRPVLADYLPAIQRYLIRQAAQQLRPELRDIGYQALQRAKDFLARPSRSGQMDWTGGLRFKLQDQLIYLAGWETLLPGEDTGNLPQVPAGQVIELNIPRRTDLENGWAFYASTLENIQVGFDEATENTNPFQAWIDASQFSSNLQVRSRKPGDTLQPLGMHGHTVKVSDLMINQKIARAARQAWPVVVCGDQIVWIPGLRLAEPFRITAYSSRSILLQLVRLE
jgi:tRNA(Ile)-lysidine synthase